MTPGKVAQRSARCMSAGGDISTGVLGERSEHRGELRISLLRSYSASEFPASGCAYGLTRAAEREVELRGYTGVALPHSRNRHLTNIGPARKILLCQCVIWHSRAFG